MDRGLSRRAFLGRAGAAAALAGVGAARIAASETSQAATPTTGAGGSAAASATVPFYGPHQAGIATPQQRHLALAAFDVQARGIDVLRTLFASWTHVAAAMTGGWAVAPPPRSELVAGIDTGETAGMSAARLTVTLGLGPSLFDDRFGLSARRPAALAPLPSFPADAIEPARSDGDLVVQACADDPQVAFHAIRQLQRVSGHRVVLRWWQSAFLPARSADGSAPRNLLGFKDGTRNVDPTDDVTMAEHVWVGEEARGATAWMRGGSYLVARRIRLRLGDWDNDSLATQQQTFGRRKDTGAPLGGAHETDVPDFERRSASGALTIPATAHIRLASPEANGGVRILRRGYSYADGVDRHGVADAGLQFLAYQRDPRRQFVVLQRRLAKLDALNEYTQHTASGVYAALPGAHPDAPWGAALTE